MLERTRTARRRLVSSLAGAIVGLLMISGPIGADLASAADARSQGDDVAYRSGDGLFRLRPGGHDLVIVEWDREAVREAALQGRRLRISAFPLSAGTTADLLLEPFRIADANARFVVGRKGQADRPLAFDPAAISLFRGSVAGHSGSHLFLALGDTVATGHIDLGARGKRYLIATFETERRRSEARAFSIFAATGAPSLPPGVPLCRVAHTERAGGLSQSRQLATPLPVGSTSDLKRLELAVDTDFEFFLLFDDVEAAAAYLLALYAQVGDLYLRDLGLHVRLVFARLWDSPNDLYNSSAPLNEFFFHWDAQMRHVERDAAQLLSGRRDYPFGGEAVVDSLCGSAAYSVVGYALGFFPDPARPSPYHYDIAVAAHELAHICGAGHTHESPLFVDTCHDPLSDPQRGTIMSYCAQTWSGGNSNQDLYFHTRMRESIDGFIDGARCIVDDCNTNGVEDRLDIRDDTSQDVDRNGIPDECEDCNANLVLDGIDLSTGSSRDLNGNMVPDECEPDCNGNLIPDDIDITGGGSPDRHGNGIPDECEADCDFDGISDYTEIQSDMSLDIDRNGVLDACQDCDADGIPDRETLAGAHNVKIASGLEQSRAGEFHASTGVLTALSGDGVGARVNRGQDLIATPDGRVLISSGGDHRVMAFGPSGEYLGDLVPTAAGGLAFPTGLTLAPDGRLLVSSRDTHSVLTYDAADGTPLGAFVATGAGGLTRPFGLVFGPNGNLFVTSDDNRVLEFDGRDGSFVRVFVGAADNAGLDRPRGLAFKPDGNLLVASFGSNEVLEFRYPTGAPLGPWARVGTDAVLTRVSPWGIRVGPNGNIFVSRTGERYGSIAPESSMPAGRPMLEDRGGRMPVRPGDDTGIGTLHLTDAQVYEFDPRDGNFLRTHVGGHDHGFLFPTGFDFLPGWTRDCNLDLLPDGCDVALGHSDDIDASGVPDECETDCNGNGRLDRLDIIPYGTGLDCNGNLVPDDCDIREGRSEDCSGNAIPDECEPDCNGNGVADSCDVATGVSSDCNANGIPDACDASDDLEIGLGWTAGAPDDTATAGLWERVDPIGTIAQPEDDHTPRPGTHCFVTGQAVLFGDADDSDVDGGRTTLFSPVLDLAGVVNATIGYWRWFSNDTGQNPAQDVLQVDISNDGGLTWTNVEIVGPTGEEASGGWFFHRFRVADLVEPTATVALRFVASDEGPRSTVEAAVDDLVIASACSRCGSDAECDDGLWCTADACDRISGRCDNAIDPTTCLIAGTCHASGDLNAENNCEVCDPSSATGWSSSPPVDVEGVSLEEADMTRLSWTDQGNGSLYDIAGSSLSALLSVGGVDDAACLADDRDVPGWIDARAAPPIGDGYYYMVRSQKDCGAGTYGTDSAGAERRPASACP